MASKGFGVIEVRAVEAAVHLILKMSFEEVVQEEGDRTIKLRFLCEYRVWYRRRGREGG